ncbi:MAG: RidA family protein [Cyanobacteria bacterium P01_E01_bin.6]
MNKAEKEAGLAETPGYRYAEKVGNQLFVAGQVPNDSNGQIVGPRDHYQQSHQCLANLRKLLVTYGYTFEHIRRMVVYVVGEQPDLMKAWDAVKDEFHGSVPPATLLGVSTLGHEGQLVEIDATVIRE